MASGGSSRRPMSSDSRSFDFGSDELLFSYEDSANAKKSDSTAKDLLENRVGRPLANLYGQQEVYPREDVLSAVEICMKKHADNLMRNLEDINGRLTQLELFCYKLERSVGEFRTDMIHGQSEADMKLNSLEKHVHEVQRSVQIIRDKQELADAHNELTKLHLSQKESARNNEDATAATSDTKPHNDNKDMSNLQLTLSLPNQIPSSHPIKPPDQNLPHKELPYLQNHASSYYSHHQPPPPPRPPPQEQHIQHLQQRTQIQNLSQYQQPWTQPSSSQRQVPPTYPPYIPYQPALTESFQSRSIGYGATGSSISHPPPQQNIQWTPPPPPPQANMQAYNPAFAVDGSRASLPQSYQTNINMASSQMMRNHPYGEIIENAVNMGYSRDHVVNVVKLMGEKGQPLDFNALLDELNTHANGGTPRAWSR